MDRCKALSAALLLMATGASQASQPSFDCGKVEEGSIESYICADDGLSELDATLAKVYKAARAKAGANDNDLKVMQRGWIKGRDDCWKSEDRTACIRDEYQRRIADLQANYRLVDFTGPVFYACDGNPANEVVITFFATEPRTLIAERGDSSAFMYPESGTDGSRYVGRNERIRLAGGKAYVVWGYEAPELDCAPNSPAG